MVCYFFFVKFPHSSTALPVYNCSYFVMIYYATKNCYCHSRSLVMMMVVVDNFSLSILKTGNYRKSFKLVDCGSLNVIYGRQLVGTRTDTVLRFFVLCVDEGEF